MLPKSLIATVLATSLFSAASAMAADDFGTAAEAQAMVKQARQHMQKVGREQAYADFTGKKAPFFDRDLYVTVTSLSGPSLAHGQNPKMVGMNMTDFKDIDGKPYFQERFELSRKRRARSGRISSSWIRSRRRCCRSRCTARPKPT